MDESRYHLIRLRRRTVGWTQLEALAADARALAEQLRAEGLPLRFLRTVSVPDDEVCFHLFEGTDAAVAEASTRAPDTYPAPREPEAPVG